MTTDPKVPPSILAAIMNQPNALTGMPMPPANLPRVPMPPPQVPTPQMADITRGAGAGSGSGKFWHITDGRGAVTGMIHKPATPFSTWRIIPMGPNGQLDQGNSLEFSTKAKAEQYLGVTLE